jgi:hypothetical protein
MPHSFDHWADTDDALDAARRWALNSDDVLHAYIGTTQAEADYEAWCDDLIADHAERQQEERRER